jgi:hypothetical protein
MMINFSYQISGTQDNRLRNLSNRLCKTLKKN